ncbi:MAG: alpha-E domain-containing protein, partial [Methylococcales bacterium]
MLSRSAERIYWLARYLERTENTARLVSIYMNFLMDMPRDVQVGWYTLVHIIGGKEEFDQLYKVANERNVCRFLLTDLNNSASLWSSLSFARENIRTSRELLPDEAWELVNEMYLFAKTSQENIVNRRARFLFLESIINNCQRFTGLLSGAMSKDSPYSFIRLG